MNTPGDSPYVVPAGWRRRLMIAVLAFTAYAPTLKMGFLWDDHVMIEGNPAIQSWSVKHLKQDFTSDAFRGQGDAYYRPAQLAMNRIDHTVWGLRPFGYHLTNLLFHAANSILVAELAIALSLGSLTALLAGCLFAVHPIGVEQLMIIAGRAELMGLFFTLACLLLLLRRERLAFWTGAGAYLFGLFSKESVLVTPFLYGLMLWYVPEKRLLWRRAWVLLVLTIPYLVLRTVAVGSPLPRIEPDLFVRFYIQAFPKVMAIYARLILVPWNLHSHRMIPRMSHFWPLYLAILVIALIWLIRGRHRRSLFYAAWFCLCLLPKTPVMMTGNFILDHWAYPAAIAVILPISMGWVWLWKTWRRGWYGLLALGFFPLLIVWALLVHLNVALRGSDEKMYRWALHFTQSNPIKYNFGILLVQTGRAAEALPYLEDFHAAYPEIPVGLYALSMAYWQAGQPFVARRILEFLMARHPDYLPAAQSYPLMLKK